jgi:hypothetical protein
MGLNAGIQGTSMIESTPSPQLEFALEASSVAPQFGAKFCPEGATGNSWKMTDSYF